MTSILRIVMIAAVIFTPAAIANEVELPRIAIVIDDLGNSRFQQQFAELPGPLTLAMLPHTPYAERIAQSAQQNGKEVIIHMPMQASANDDAGAGMLSSEDDKAETILLMEQAFIQIPQAVGMNNHMGSRLTALIEPMQWVMEQLALRNFYFLDSRTTAATQAENVAREFGIPVARRHVFLDNNPEPAEIALRWKDLIRHAHKHGEAIAIAHPHRSTLEFLKEVLPNIERHYGVKLVVASSLAQRPDTETIQLTEHKVISKDLINEKDIYQNEN
jgi:hypothetical protein